MDDIEKVYENVRNRIDEEVLCEDCPFECDGTLPCYLVTMCAALKEKQKRDKMCCENCKYEPRNPTGKTLPCSMCNIAYASYFEPKQEAAK